MLADRELFFKQSFQLVFGIAGGRAGVFPGVPKTEKVAEIGAIFIEDAFGLPFAAIIVSATLVKYTVLAAVQIGKAERALRLSADEQIVRNFF